MNIFDAGDRGRLNVNWNPNASMMENMTSAERGMIRARAQDLERNSDIAGAILTAFDRNVVGSGITLQAKVDESDKLNNQIEKLWKEFCKAENCDITGTQTMEEIEKMLLRRYIVDGGVLIVKVNVSDDKYPFKIQVRSVDELNTLIYAADGNRIVEGVELDKNNRPVAYHFKKYDGTSFIPGESVRIKADDVIFLFQKNNPEQVREISRLATALPRIKDANQFIEAVSIKERVLACMAVFIKKATPSSIGRSVGTGRKDIDYNGIKLSPGMIGELNPGDEVQTVIPSGQASDSKDFITTLVRLSAAGIGLSYEAVSRDLSQVNYSSARQGLIEDKKTYKDLQKMLVEKFLTPVYLEFLSTAYLKGLLPIPDFMNNLEKYTPHVWIPPGSTWIDPVKEVNANKTAIESNQDTLARICAERGEDWREVIKQRAAEQKLVNELMGVNEDATTEEDGTDEANNDAEQGKGK